MIQGSPLGIQRQVRDALYMTGPMTSSFLPCVRVHGSKSRRRKGPRRDPHHGFLIDRRDACLCAGASRIDFAVAPSAETEWRARLRN